MEHYKLKDFAKWAKKVKLGDEELMHILHEKDQGLMGDRLGGYIFKKRIRISGRGKRGGGRTIILYKAKEFSLFLYGYAKNEKSDLTDSEHDQLRYFARQFSKLTFRDRVKLHQEGSY